MVKWIVFGNLVLGFVDFILFLKGNVSIVCIFFFFSVNLFWGLVLYCGCKKLFFVEFDNFLYLLYFVCFNILVGFFLECCNVLMMFFLYMFVVKWLFKGLVFLILFSFYEFVFNLLDMDGWNLFVLFILLKIFLRIF